jgi:hypothetical protein
MSIDSDIKTALDSMTLSTLWANYIPDDINPPATTYVRESYDPLMKLDGPAGLAKSIFTFHCWGKKGTGTTAKANAIAIAEEVKAKIEAASSLSTKFRLPVPSEEFAEETLQVMEPVRYSFWHSDP